MLEALHAVAALKVGQYSALEFQMTHQGVLVGVSTTATLTRKWQGAVFVGWTNLKEPA